MFTNQKGTLSLAQNFAQKTLNTLSEKERRFVLIDSLLCPEGDDDKIMLARFQDVKSVSANAFYAEAIARDRNKIRENGGPYKGDYNTDMLPEQRFLLSRKAVEDPALTLTLRRWSVDRNFLQYSMGLATAQILALLQNQEQVFRERFLQGRIVDERGDFLNCIEFTEDWFSSRLPLLQSAIFTDLARYLSTSAVVHPQLAYICKEWKAKHVVPLSSSDELAQMLPLLFWQGEIDHLHEVFQGLVKKPLDIHTELQLYFLRGYERLLNGDPHCLESFDDAVGVIKKMNNVRKKSVHLGYQAGLFRNLARFLYGGPAELEEMREDLSFIVNIEVAHLRIAQMGKRGFVALMALDALRQGNEERAVRLLSPKDITDGEFKALNIVVERYNEVFSTVNRGFRGGERIWLDQNFLSSLLYYGAKVRLNIARSEDIIALQTWELQTEGFPLLQNFFRDLRLRALKKGSLLDSEIPFSFAELVKRTNQRWELQLVAFENMLRGQEVAATHDTKKKEKEHRIIWEVNYKRDYVLPIEQVLQSKERWSKGKAISLKKIANGDGLDRFTGKDRIIASRIKSYTDWYHGMVYIIPLSSAYGELIGHPRTFERLETKELSPLKIQEKNFDFTLSTKGKECLLSLPPKQIEFIEKTNKNNEDVFFSYEPGTLSVYKVTNQVRQAAMILGEKGMAFPRSELGRVLALTRSEFGFAIRADLEAELVDACTAPVIQLEQVSGEKFAGRIGVRPFARLGTPFFETGEGIEEPITVLPESDGTKGELPVRTKRDFVAEKEALERLCHVCPSLAEGLEDKQWLSSDPEDILHLLEELHSCGEPNDVEWPKGMNITMGQTIKTQQVKISINKVSQDWFDIDGNIEIGEHRLLSVKSLLASLKGSRFVKLKDGEYLALTEELRRKLLKLKLIAGGKGGMQVNTLAVNALEDLSEGMAVEADEGWKKSLDRMKQAFESEPEVPNLLQANLREYQVEGYQWMQRLAIWGVGACLADDMGLGKTLQTIAVMLNEAKNGPCLVIAPTSVCANWEAEISRFAPSLQVQTLSSLGREETIKAMGPNQVLILGYGLLLNVEEAICARTWAMLVFDEAQALKNASTRRAKAGKRIPANFRVALTGTPIENKIDDMWSLFNTIVPGLLGSWEQFHKRFGNATPGMGTNRTLRSLIKPFILRRLKSAVLDELPPRTEQTLVIEPNDKELVFYEKIRQAAVERLQQGGPENQRRFAILAALTKLRMTCCHPALADADMAKLEKYSSKTERFLELVEELISSGHKILAFSQFTSYLGQIKAALTEKKVSFQYLDGSTNEKERRERVAAFQAGQGDVFLLSLKAGGTGINLTAADYVIHLDPWWNPAVEDQASDRAHRMGQNRPVTIYRLVMAHTVEEKILKLHSAKRELAADFLEGTETSVKALTEEELLSLLES